MVDKKRKILDKILAGSRNIKAFGFGLVRVSGSHHIFTHPDVTEIVNIQNKKGDVTPYQVRQFISLIEKYNLKIEDEG